LLALGRQDEEVVGGGRRRDRDDRDEDAVGASHRVVPPACGVGVAVGAVAGSAGGVVTPPDVAVVAPVVVPVACWPVAAAFWTVMSSTLGGTLERSKNATMSKAGARLPGHRSY